MSIESPSFSGQEPNKGNEEAPKVDYRKMQEDDKERKREKLEQSEWYKNVEMRQPEGDWVMAGADMYGVDQNEYGTYSIHNGIIAYATKMKGGGGVVYCAPFTQERRDDLISKNYTESGFRVPSLNDEDEFARNRPGTFAYDWKMKFEKEQGNK